MSSCFKQFGAKTVDPWNRGSTARIPEDWGRYHILDQEGSLLYVGISFSSIRSRIYDHKASGKLLEYEIVEYHVADNFGDPRDLRRYEIETIYRHRPPRNERAGGGGDWGRRARKWLKTELNFRTREFADRWLAGHLTGVDEIEYDIADLRKSLGITEREFAEIVGPRNWMKFRKTLGRIVRQAFEGDAPLTFAERIGETVEIWTDYLEVRLG